MAQTLKNPGWALRSQANRARIGQMPQNKNCADYIQQLLNEVETQT